MPDAIITLTGNLGREPESRQLNNGSAVVSTRIAVQQGRDSTMWLDLQVWQSDDPATATALMACAKGARVDVVGRLTSRTWTDRDAHLRTSYCVTAYHVRAWPAREDEGTGAISGTQRREASPQQQHASGVPFDDDDALPF